MSVVLLGNPTEAKNEGKGKNKRHKTKREGLFTRHLPIHLTLHVWSWRATADHTLRGNVVTVRRLGRWTTLAHPTRTHWHVLSGRLHAQKRETKTNISLTETLMLRHPPIFGTKMSLYQNVLCIISKNVLYSI